MDQLYDLTQIKKKTLKELGYRYVCIWEHQWSKIVREDSEVRDIVANLDVQERLDPRESFFGGRTNAAKLHYKVDVGQKIKYVDFTRYVCTFT